MEKSAEVLPKFHFTKGVYSKNPQEKNSQKRNVFDDTGIGSSQCFLKSNGR